MPIFFVTVGARADLGVLNPTVPGNRAGLLIAVFLMGVAIIGKLITRLGKCRSPRADLTLDTDSVSSGYILTIAHAIQHSCLPDVECSASQQWLLFILVQQDCWVASA